MTYQHDLIKAKWCKQQHVNIKCWWTWGPRVQFTQIMTRKAKKNIQLNGYLAWLFYVWNLFNYNWNIKEVWQQFVFLVWKSSQDLWYANRNANAQMDYSKTRKKKDAAMIDRLTIVTDQQLPGWANKCNTSCRGAFTFFSEVLDLHEQHIRKKSK